MDFLAQVHQALHVDVRRGRLGQRHWVRGHRPRHRLREQREDRGLGHRGGFDPSKALLQWVASLFLFLGKGSPLKSTTKKRVPFFPMATGHLRRGMGQNETTLPPGYGPQVLVPVSICQGFHFGYLLLTHTQMFGGISFGLLPGGFFTGGAFSRISAFGLCHGFATSFACWKAERDMDVSQNRKLDPSKVWFCYGFS